jgi:hypothetical protein
MKKKIIQYVLLCYDLFNLLIKKSIKRFSFISYNLILKNLDYKRNNKCYIIIIIFFFFWREHKLYARGCQIFKYGPVCIQVQYNNILISCNDFCVKQTLDSVFVHI